MSVLLVTLGLVAFSSLPAAQATGEDKMVEAHLDTKTVCFQVPYSVEKKCFLVRKEWKEKRKGDAGGGGCCFFSSSYYSYIRCVMGDIEKYTENRDEGFYANLFSGGGE